MKLKILVFCTFSLLACQSNALDLNNDINEVESLITSVFPYPTLPANGCPADGQFGKGHFGKGADALTSCPGSSDSSLGFGRIFRGGFPNYAGVNCLRSMGVTAIFDLRTESTVDDGKEPEMARDAGIQYFSFPMEVMTNTPGSQACANDRMNSSQCNQRSIVDFVHTLRQYLAQNPNAKIYVHCARGQDRTSLAMAFFRVKIQGCSKDLARQEMLSYRYNPTKPLESVWNNIDQL